MVSQQATHWMLPEMRDGLVALSAGIWRDLSLKAFKGGK